MSSKFSEEDLFNELLKQRMALPANVEDISIMALLYDMELGDAIDQHVERVAETARETTQSLARMGLHWLRYMIWPEEPDEFTGAAFEEAYLSRKFEFEHGRKPTDEELKELLKETPFYTAPGMPWKVGGLDVVIPNDPSQISNYLRNWYQSQVSTLRAEFGSAGLPNEQRVISTWVVLLYWGPYYISEGKTLDDLAILTKYAHFMPPLSKFRNQRPVDWDELLEMLENSRDYSQFFHTIHDYYGLEPDKTIIDEAMEKEPDVDGLEMIAKGLREPDDDFSVHISVDHEKKVGELTIHASGKGFPALMFLIQLIQEK